MIFAVILVALPVLAIGGPVNTFPGWNGTDTIGAFGNPDTSTYGEAITTPGGMTSVTDFSFWLQESQGFQFQAFISPWDNTNYALTGSLLYLSPITTAADGSLDEYTFNVGSVPVIAGTIYMFGVTINNVYATDAGLTGTMGGDIYSNGNSTYYFAWNNDSGDGSLLYANWDNAGCADNTGACGQAAFLADFNGVPEPGSLMLLGSGLLLLGGIARRKARR